MIMMLFVLIMGILCLTDLRRMTIPNAIVLPGILLGSILTGQWLPMLFMFGIGTLLYSRKVFCGGDVKLLALIGAFLGWWAVLAFMISRVIIIVYRKVNQYEGQLAYAPFIGLACVPFLFM